MEFGESSRRFSLNSSNISDFIFPSDNEETISNINPPDSFGLDLSESVTSLNSSTSSRQKCELESTRHDKDNNSNDFVSGSNYNSEPEDMQDYIQPQNKNLANTDDILNSSFTLEADKSFETMAKSDGFISPFTSSPLALRGKKVSLSLQDMSAIETFPLIPKTNNGFSSETIPSQSLSSTTKSKDSGFQRSASCLSLNSGNRTYDHVQSKVKQYIRDIKSSEECRKKQKLARISQDNLNHQKQSDISCNVVTDTINNNNELVRSVNVLKNELREKDSTLKQLQENYNNLLQKYGEAINQIDLLRLRNSNSSYLSDFAVSNEDLSNNYYNYSKNPYVSSNPRLGNDDQCEKVFDYSASLPNKLLSLSMFHSFEAGSKESFKVKSESSDTHLSRSNSPQDFIKSESKDESRPQSSTSSTIVSSTPRPKTLALGPISKYYSSSSKLGKNQHSPLPSAKFGNDNDCNKPTIQRKTAFKTNSLPSFSNEPKGSSLRSNQIHNISKVHPFERIHSYLEKVNPFKEMWQVPLPTKDLIDSIRSSSSDDSANNYDSIQTNGVKNRFTSQRKTPINGISREINRSQSEHNLSSNHKTFSDYSIERSESSSQGVQDRTKKIDHSSGLFNANNFETNKLGGTENRTKKCIRNLLAGSDAFEAHATVDLDFSDDADKINHVNFDSGDIHKTDDSSSISSSIFSFAKDDECPKFSKQTLSKCATNSDKKTSSSASNVKSTVWEKRKSCRSLSPYPKPKKSDRTYYSPKPRRAAERKPSVKNASQENQKESNSKPHSSYLNKKTESLQKLKVYTEILKYYPKPNRDIGVQVSCTGKKTKQFQEPEDVSKLNRLDCLNEASEYLEQMRQGMDRLYDYIETLRSA